MSVERSALNVDRSVGNADGNPWPGLESFTESQRQLFFGRDRETDELARLVRRETLTVLFGQSGLGKSSLLQAGLFPLLRENDYLPLYLRLDHSGRAPIADCGSRIADSGMPIGSGSEAGSIASPRSPNGHPQPSIANRQSEIGNSASSIRNPKSEIRNSPSLADQVKAALNAAFVEAKADAPPLGPDESLWEYFHRKDVDIWSTKNRLLTPVLVFDQFEEIFTLGRADDDRRARSRAFLTALAELVENRPPAALREKFDRGEADPTRYNFDKPSCRVILSLREDFLPDLEGLRQELPAIVHNRLRLKRLNGAQALEAVTRPAPHLLAGGVGERIVEFVAGAHGGSTERLLELEVEPALLSVICRELNERRRALGQAQITADLVSGNRREILTNFYERSVADLPEPMRAFVEDHLLTKSGFRDNLALETALEFPGVTRPLIDTLVSRRLLRIEDRLGVQRVELTHDVLAEVIRASRDARQQRLAIENERRRERVTRRRMWLARTIAAGLLVLCAGVSWVAWRAIRAEREQARLRAEADAVRNREAALRLEAEAQELAARRKAYASDMNGVQHALAAENLGRARELLDRHRPAPGEPDMRRWEWRYLWQFCQSDAIGELKTPDDIELMSVAISADGQWAALGSRRGGKVTLCHLATREQILLPTGNMNIRLAFSPVEPLLAIFAMETQAGRPPDYKLVIWDLKTRSVQRELALDGFCSGLAFSPEGETLVASIGNRASDPERAANIIRWRVVDGSKIAVHKAGRWSSSTGSSWFATSPDSTLAAVGTGPGTGVSVVDLQTGQARWSAVATEDQLRCMAFSPDGRVLATGAGYVDPVIRLWDVQTGRDLGKLEGQRGWTAGLAFLADGRHLVSASADQTLRLWDLETRTVVRAFRGHKTEVHALAIAPDQKTLISGCKDGSAYEWRLEAAPTSLASGLIKTERGTPGFSPSGDAVIAVGLDGSVSRWDGPSFQTETRLKPVGPLHRDLERWNVDAVMARTRPWIALTTAENKVRVWDWKRSALVREWSFPATAAPFPRAFVDNETRLLVSVASASTPWAFTAVREWMIETGRETLSVELPETSGQARWGEVSPDGRDFLGIEPSTGNGFRWNLATGQTSPVALKMFQANWPVFSPDQRLVVITSQAGFVKVFDATTLAERATLRGFMFGTHGADFSKDMQRLAIGSNGSESLTLWDVNSFERLITLPSPIPVVEPVIFSPDGNVITGQSNAGGATSGRSYFWRAPSWEEIEAAERKARPQ